MEKRPSGEIIIYDPRGYAYFAKDIQKELGIKGKGKIEYYKDANCVLLVRNGASRKDVLKGIDILKADLELRWKEENPKEAEVTIRGGEENEG